MTRASQPSARMRQRKLTTKQHLHINVQNEVEDYDFVAYWEEQERQQKAETGVEKGEESVSPAIFSICVHYVT